MAILVVFQNGRYWKYQKIYNFACDWLIQGVKIYILKVQKSNGDVFKPIESLLLLPVDFLIIFLIGLPMKMHDLSNINECGSTSKT